MSAGAPLPMVPGPPGPCVSPPRAGRVQLLDRNAPRERRLRALVSREYKGLSPAPRLVGPDVWVPCLVHGEPGGPATAGSTPACDVTYLRAFFAAQPDLDVVTFHL